MHLFRIGLQRQFRRSFIFASTESELKSSLDKAPRLNNDIWSLSSDTICQLNQLFSNGEAAMLSSAADNVAIFPLIGHADKIHDIKGDVYPKIDRSNSYFMLFKI